MVAAVFTVGTLPFSEATCTHEPFSRFSITWVLIRTKSKEEEVFDTVGPVDDKIRPTGGWFYFVGELVKGEG